MGSEVPDVTAYEVGEARRLLEAAGVKVVRERHTAPPWPGTGEGEERVLQQLTVPGGVELVVAREAHLRPPT